VLVLYNIMAVYWHQKCWWGYSWMARWDKYRSEWNWL